MAKTHTGGCYWRCGGRFSSLVTSLFLQSARQSGRGKQFGEFAPPFLGIGAASFLNVTAHHVFPEIVVDHVTSITLDEFHPLLSASWFHHCVFLQPLHHSSLVDLTVDQSSRGLVSGITQILHQILHGVIFVCA